MDESIVIGVVVVFHSGLEGLKACLKSIKESCPPARVCVVDASSRGDAREVAVLFACRWIDGKRNAGYAWGAHLGLVSFDTAPDVVVISNPDVRFEGGCLQLLASSSLEHYGICYPIQYTSNGDPAVFNILPQLTLRTSTAAWIGVLRRSGRRRRAGIVDFARTSGEDVRLAVDLAGSGAVVAMPVDLWHQLGGLDKDYFLFEEDRTLGKRASDVGSGSYLCGSARVMHDGGFNNRDRSLLSVAEPVVSEQLAWKKYGNRRGLPIVSLQVIGLAGRCFLSGVHGRRVDARIYFTAALVALRHSRGSVLIYAADGLRIPCVGTE